MIKYSDVNEKIITIRDERVILDSDVAALYGVATREINQAVKNNPDKFPKKYVVELKQSEFRNLRSKILTTTSEDADNDSITALRSKKTTADKTKKIEVNKKEININIVENFKI